MKIFKSKTAIVTGAASGIGAGIALTLAREGTNLALLDIQEAALEKVADEARSCGVDAITVLTDVSDARAVAAAAQRAEAAFGRIHLAVNNAGIALHGTQLEEIALEDWNWVIGVNILGVIHGIRSFIPLIRKHGEGGHVVNVASIGGLQVHRGWNTGAYSMTKYAVVALSEALEHELEGSGIGVSVLCPAAVRTAIYDSAKYRPARLGGPCERAQQRFLKDAVAGGLDPLQVGERLLDAIREGEFFVFTHSETRQWIEDRHRRIMRAFDRLAEIETQAGPAAPPARVPERR